MWYVAWCFSEHVVMPICGGNIVQAYVCVYVCVCVCVGVWFLGSAGHGMMLLWHVLMHMQHVTLVRRVVSVAGTGDVPVACVFHRCKAGAWLGPEVCPRQAALKMCRPYNHVVGMRA